jgi:hypothetical protein
LRRAFDGSFPEKSGCDQIRAISGEESYVAEGPVAVLGLVKLIDERGWEWQQK